MRINIVKKEKIIIAYKEALNKMRAKLLKGYPVIGLEDGSLLGKVQDITINQTEKKVEGLLVGEKSLLKEKSEIIPYRQVYNIGKDVLIIKNKEGQSLGVEEPREELLSYYSFLGNSIISNKGDYIAKIHDFTFSVESGKIESLLLHDIKSREKVHKNIFLSIEGVLKLGKDYVIIRDDYASYLSEEEKEEDTARFRMPIYSLEMRAIDFALEKEAAHTVKDNHGEIIVEKGETITDEIIDKARAAGRLYQVLFAAGVGELLDSIDYTVEKLDKGSTLLLQAWQNLKNRSRYIFKGSLSPEQEEMAAPEEPDAQKEYVESGETAEKTSYTREFLENIKEIWGRLEKEISREGKVLAHESREKMKEYILDKKANYSVRGNRGELLVGPGEKITREIIQTAETQQKTTALFLAAVTQEMEDSMNNIGEKINDIFR